MTRVSGTCFILSINLDERAGADVLARLIRPWAGTRPPYARPQTPGSLVRLSPPRLELVINPAAFTHWTRESDRVRVVGHAPQTDPIDPLCVEELQERMKLWLGPPVGGGGAICKTIANP